MMPIPRRPRAFRPLRDNRLVKRSFHRYDAFFKLAGRAAVSFSYTSLDLRVCDRYSLAAPISRVNNEFHVKG